MAELIDKGALIETIKSEWDMQELYLPVHFIGLVESMPTVNNFNEEKYEKIVLAEMERKHTEQQQLLSELKAVLPTTTEADIRAKAIDETVAKLKDWMFENDGLSVKDVREIDEIAEQLKGE